MSEYSIKAINASKHKHSKRLTQKHGKFKPKSMPVHPTRIVLESNWSFHDEDLSSDDESESSAPNFEDVLRASTNIGGHFLFKSEKASASSRKQDEDLKSTLFNIDGKLLQSALATIPFYERLGMDQSLFTADEIEQQDRLATENEEYYRSLCESRGREMINYKKKKLPDIHHARFVEETETDYSTKDELDELLEGTKAFHIVVEPIHRIKTATSERPVEPESKENMQKWLDDLLL